MARAAISVVVPTYNRRKTLHRVLEAFEHQVLLPGTRAEVIVVDDGSTDDTARFLESWKPVRCDFRYQIAARNAGPGEARTQGVALATADLVAFTGDDILPAPTFLAAHLAAHRQLASPRIAVLGKSTWPADMPITTVMRHVDGVGAQQFGYHWLKHGQFLDYTHFYTSNISLPRALLREEPQLFDRRFTQYGYEDIDLGLRLEGRGMRLYYSAQAVGYHYHPYTAHGFCDRQLKAGAMACVMADKHPRSRGLVGVAAIDALAAAPAPELARRAEIWLEGAGGRAAMDRALIALASFYELREVPPLDGLYVALFRYFYDQGIVSWRYPGPKGERLLESLLVRDVAPAVQSFLRDLRIGALPGPREVITYFEARHLLPCPPTRRRPAWRRAAGRVRRALVSR